MKIKKKSNLLFSLLPHPTPIPFLAHHLDYFKTSMYGLVKTSSQMTMSWKTKMILSLDQWDLYSMQL